MLYQLIFISEVYLDKRTIISIDKIMVTKKAEKVTLFSFCPLKQIWLHADNAYNLLIYFNYNLFMKKVKNKLKIL